MVDVDDLVENMQAEVRDEATKSAYGSFGRPSLVSNLNEAAAERSVAFLDINYSVTQGCRRNRLKSILRSVRCPDSFSCKTLQYF